MRKLSNQEISRICRSLSLLLHAGISVGDGLFLLAEEEETEAELLEQLGRQLDDGRLLAQAMEDSGCFPVYVTGLVKAGEATGHLEEALLALADYYDRQERMSCQIRQTLFYPALLLGMMILVVGVLLVKVLPVFDDVYAALGGGLTGAAGYLLQLGRFLKAALPVLCLVLLAAAGAVLVCIYHASVRAAVLSGLRKRWGDKGVWRKVYDARFAQALAMGLRSGMPVEEAIDLAGGVLKDVPGAEQRCRTGMEALAQGAGLAQVLKDSQILPATYCRMLELGIRGGNGDQVMNEIAGRLSEEAGRALEEKAALIEPVMVMTASVLVGMILLAVMLPLMNIMSAIG